MPPRPGPVYRFIYRLTLPLRKFPFVEAKLLPLYRHLRWYKRRAVEWVRVKTSKYYLPDPDKIYWIEPSRIVYHTNNPLPSAKGFEERVFDRRISKGKVVGGDWDITIHKFQDMSVFKAFKARIEAGAPWESTKFYKQLIQKIEKGHTVWNCANVEQLRQRFRQLDELINDMKQHGYKPYYKILEEQGIKRDIDEAQDEIATNISRDGQYLFEDGRHRLAVAKLLRIPRIPVKVIVRHKQWVQFRQELLSYARECGGKMYQPALHPDLSDIPAAHACQDRFDAMKQYLPSQPGYLLDVGANLGYFCHKFEELGYKCVAVEYERHIARLMEKLRKAENKKFMVVHGDILEPETWEKIRRPYQIVLLLNILHHFLKKRTTFDLMTAWLHQLKADTIFFEPHLPEEPQMKGAYKNLGPQEFAKYIQSLCRKKNAIPIHKSHDNRVLYVLR